MHLVNNDLFSIDKITHEDGAISATLNIDAENAIFRGHFPGQPVVPGACMLQIVKEVLELALKHPIRLKKADQLKFMIMIDPANIPSVQLEIVYKLLDENTISATAKLLNGGVTCFKFQGTFSKQQFLTAVPDTTLS
jgi:3-hydroxyacyl-[acyl-carrier-protein] dehydratase